MADPLLIGIDLGTTNGKVACYDARGERLAEAARGYPTHYPRPGLVEQNPADWRAALESALAEVAGALGERAADVVGISLSNFGPGLVAVDAAGDPLAPCPTWQDERAQPQGRRLIDAVGTDWIGLGSPLTGFPARLMWFVEEQPDLAARADQLLDIKGFLLRWLTARAATDPSSGPGAEGWFGPAFEFAGWPVERLATVVPSTEQAGALRAEIAGRVGLPAGTPIFAGTNDGAAATLGSGVIALGDGVITLGTNGVVRVVIPHRLPPDALLTRHMFSWPYMSGRWIGGGFTFSGAGSLQWLADLFGIPRDRSAYDALLAEASSVPPGSRGVSFLPYLAGRGTPEADPALRGGFVGVGLAHGRPELTRAVLEGVTFALAEIIDAFERLGLDAHHIRVTGGGARSPLWRQIVADVLNRPVSRAGGDSTLGGAVIAAVGSGLYPDLDTATGAMVRTLSHEEPNPATAAAYEDIRAFFTQTRDAMLAAPRPVETANTPEPENEEATPT
jgi:xylulokinase